MSNQCNFQIQYSFLTLYKEWETVQHLVELLCPLVVESQKRRQWNHLSHTFCKNTITLDTKYYTKWHLQTSDARPLSRTKTSLKFEMCSLNICLMLQHVVYTINYFRYLSITFFINVSLWYLLFYFM